MKINTSSDHFLIKKSDFKDLFNIMKICLFLLFAFTLQLMATNTNAQDAIIELRSNSVTVSQLISEIEKQTDYLVVYSNREVNTSRTVSLKNKSDKVSEYLNQTFSGTDIGYDFEKNYIVLSKKAQQTASTITNLVQTLQQQGKTVRGTVTDSNGEPVIGATIIVKDNPSQGTVTDIDGNFILSNLPENTVLQITYVGMKPQDISVGNQTTLNITMEEDAIGLQEVVAIGYGSQKREQVTSSISSLSEKDFLQGAIYQSPLELLSGKIGGLAISRRNGGDPTGGIDIQLRGVSSIRGDAAPLIIIDGVPGGSLNAISPESIEKVDVLRDGSAAAIYGTRATNGVIIITTKKGTPGKLQTNYSGYSYTERWFNKPKLLSSIEYRNIKTKYINSEDPFLKEVGSSMIDYGNDTDWLDALTQNVISHVHDLSISGGTEKTQYYGSFNFRDQNGFIKRTGSQVMSQKLSLTQYGLNNRLMVRFNINNSFTKSNPTDYEIMVQGLIRNPTQPIYNKDRSPDIEVFNPDGYFYEELGLLNPNPLGLIEQFERDNENSIFLGNIDVKYEFIDNLRVSVNAAYMRSSDFNGFYESRESWSNYSSTGYGGVARRNAGKYDTRTLESLIDYSNTFGDVHNLTALIGYSYQDFTNENFSAENHNFLSDSFLYNNLGAGVDIGKGRFVTPVSSNKSLNKLMSFFSRVNYSYNDKYLLSASLRREGSTKFGKDNKWGNFPAVSVGWLISREPFMNSIDIIDNFKIRFGLGITGNQGISNYLSLQRLGSSSLMYYNEEWVQGFTPISNPNPNLRWEKKTETNLGFDIDLFNRLSINLDLYNRNTTDLLYEYSVPVPPNLYGSTWANVGNINNKGIELTVNANPISTSTFSWSSNFNISFNKNMLVSLSNEDYSHNYLMSGNLGGRIINYEYTYKLEEGQPIGNIFGYEYAGISDDGKWLVLDKSGNKIHPSEGDFEDKRIIGNGLPKGWFGFTNTFKYHNFDFTVALRGAFAFDILNTYRIAQEGIKSLPANIPSDVFTDPVVSKVRDQANFLTSFYVEDGDYLKLDNFTIGYTIPFDFFKNTRIYFSGRNLFALTKFRGEDPESSISGLTPAYDSWNEYPKVKTYSIGININF
ncbi:TonB-dependent receptor SusC [anaerobic digester metagenome]